MSNTPTMKSRYERLLSDASKHIPAVADETTDIPVFSLALNDKGELLIGQLLDDSIYHFFIVKTYKTHVPSASPVAEQTGALSFATASLSSGRQPPQSTNKDSSEGSGYGLLHFILLVAVMFLLVGLARYLRSKGFE